MRMINNKLWLGAASLALCLAPIAGHAAAAAGSVSGQVNVNGVVTASCSGSIAGTINLGELDGANGQLDPSFTTNATHGNTVQASVICNSNAPTVTISATRLSDGVTPPDPATYTSTVDYTAKIDIATATPGTFTATYPTAGAGGPQSPGTAIGAALSAAPNNVTISVTSLVPVAKVLTAGSYSGVISVTISPS